MANVNVRGTGKSEGDYQFGGEREVKDISDAIYWLADQEWCDGNVGTFGMSYYSMNAFQVAMLEPEPLKCLFAPYGLTDWYRFLAYREGILASTWVSKWYRKNLDNPRMSSQTREELGEEPFQKRIEEALSDPEIWAQESLVEALENPEENPLIVDIVLNEVRNDYWKEREVSFENTHIPAYMGADWGDTALHLPGAFWSWEHWQGPKKLVVGPTMQPDRPLYQFQYESLRWFDHWLKDRDTKIMNEPDVRVYVPPEGRWRSADRWPLPETTFTPFYLHGSAIVSDHASDVGLLSEHEIFEGEEKDTFADSPFEHGALWYETPPMVESTLVCGPLWLNLYASTTSTDELFFVAVYDRHPDGTREQLTRGWLRGSQRAVDEERSLPWYAYHSHEEREPLTPGEVYEFTVNVGPTARRFQKGHRIGLRIKCSDAHDEDDELVRSSGQTGARMGHIESQEASRISVYRSDDYPSHLMVPVAEGNVVGTYISGSRFEEAPYQRVRRPSPTRKVKMEKRDAE